MNKKSQRRKNLGIDMLTNTKTNDDESLLIEDNNSHKRKFSDDDHDIISSRKLGLGGDWLSIILLLILYILQGIPLGLTGSIPMILSNRKVSYAQQAIFSFATWPFSVKLIWAPIVDSIYSQRFGRRKSWLVPTQYLIGIFMLMLSFCIDYLLSHDGSGPNVYLLTAVFLALNFLAATQDIAVDGWALTMLSRRNVGYASTCNSVGQTAGFFLGNVVFLALESANFCNRFLRNEPQPNGLVTLSGFFYFWAIVFLVTTTIVMLFKRERSSDDDSEMTVLQTYSMLYRILRLPTVQIFTLILLTCKISFGVTDGATGLKLIESGVQKENLALLAIPITPLQIILPWIISKYTAGPRPLDTFVKAYPLRILAGIIFAFLLWWTREIKSPNGSFPSYYYIVIVVAYAFHQVALYSMFVALMSFHAKISDRAIGGTYMTLLNTLTNLGGNWPSTLALWFIDTLTYKNCSNSGSPCNDKESNNGCVEAGGTCDISLDGYYVELGICTIIGIAWLKIFKNQVRRLQSLPPSSWKCT